MGAQWSPINEGAFTLNGTVRASAANIVVSEIHYHPVGAGPEFIELLNVGAVPADLSGAQFANGIDYEFPPNTVLASGARVVVTEAQFLNGSNLSNGGERLTLVGADGVTGIRDFTYGDSEPWPGAPDGLGPSLVLKNPSTANATDAYHNNAANWRSSVAAGGSAGGSDATAFTGNPAADLDLDGLNALLEYALGTSDTDNAEGLAAWSLVPDVVVPGTWLFTHRRAVAADDLVITVEQSTDLQSWTATGVVAVSIVQSGAIETVTLRITPSAGAARTFVHVKVVKP